MIKPLHALLWFLVFFEFIIEDFLNVPSGVTKLGPPAIVLILLSLKINQKKNILFPHISLFFLICAAILSSAIWNGTKLFDLINYTLYTIFPFLYFVVIVNEDNQKLLKFVVKTVIILFMIQIPACLIKFSLVGIAENYIGTISYASGSISTVIPMIVAAFCFSAYLYTQDNKYLYLILLFIVFGITGGKRAILIFIPLQIFAIYIYFSFVNKPSFNKLIKQSTVVAFMLLAIGYVILKSVPSLNPENKVWGSFDPVHAAEYIERYTEIGQEPSAFSNFQEMRRYEGFKYFIGYLYDQPIMTFLLGDGPGYLLASKYNQLSGENPMLEHYGVRYGGRMGFIWIYMQIGIIGVALVTLLMIRILIHVVKKRKNNYHHLAFLGMWVAIVFDTLIYSRVSVSIFAIVGTFYLYYGLVYKDIKVKNKDYLDEFIPSFKEIKITRTKISKNNA